ncbi:ribosomal-processing cysteine protease Prp [Ligilactobacillus animalis]|uniref:ribosomal-processing cysteine protease Prp n=2 Tax=Ligilactobacillus animalis TaxID=1605 RepID=UPI002902DD04|nr:ribosomal-processing cysteine protease Prp [Ligilactobacillus animalis]MDU1488242.1 ribosomal-processing cysteine protease Prp [Ligilactobacillus animalis]
MMKRKNNKMTITASGHAEYSAYGSDIVCASFSTLLTHTVNNCTNVSVSDENGTLTAIFLDANRIENKTLLNALKNTVSQLASQYGDYIKITF